jgi:acyl dehydratase/NAD(P)-dependent dehydrogenase (short-subunit alcohol dehydrogenase family)
MTAAPASRIFTEADQIAFARLSSDFNPMHLDRAFARRTQMGAPVVHGIHHLAWASDAVLQAFPVRLARLSARFLQPLYLDELASIRIREQSDSEIAFVVVAGEAVVAQVRLSTEQGKPIAEPIAAAATATAPLLAPFDLALDELAGRSGAVRLPPGDVRSLFPSLAGTIGPAAVKRLLATSQIVGMACPGLHSLFTGIDVTFKSANRAEDDRDITLAYAVVKVDPRFRSLLIDVAGGAVSGRLEAFSRQRPPAQASMAEIGSRITGAPFANQRSLVIGGSRGLGEVTAKLVAAGGGHTVITYRDSAREAERVATEIVAAGGRCELLRYDALSPAREQLQASGTFDSCYFFATPKIFQRKSSLYEPAKLATFLRVYADGFFDLCAALAGPGRRRIAVFYPSSIVLEQRVSGTAEYAMAKAAGEVLAQHINEFMEGIEVLCRRLPRILTDQTATVGVASAENALDVMLPIVHEVQQMARPAPSQPN